MQSILIDLDSQKDMSFLLEFIKRMGYKSRIITDKEKEDLDELECIRLYDQAKAKKDTYRPLKDALKDIEKKRRKK